MRLALLSRVDAAASTHVVVPLLPSKSRLTARKGSACLTANHVLKLHVKQQQQHSALTSSRLVSSGTISGSAMAALAELPGRRKAPFRAASCSEPARGGTGCVLGALCPMMRALLCRCCVAVVLCCVVVSQPS